MADKFDSKNGDHLTGRDTVKPTSDNPPSDNPLEELARIIGYNDDTQSQSLADTSQLHEAAPISEPMSAGQSGVASQGSLHHDQDIELDFDLEAELMQEIGAAMPDELQIDAPQADHVNLADASNLAENVVPEPAMPDVSTAPVSGSKASLSEPVDAGSDQAHIDDVLADMERYALPQSGLLHQETNLEPVSAPVSSPPLDASDLSSPDHQVHEVSQAAVDDNLSSVTDTSSHVVATQFPNEDSNEALGEISSEVSAEMSIETPIETHEAASDAVQERIDPMPLNSNAARQYSDLSHENHDMDVVQTQPVQDTSMRDAASKIDQFQPQNHQAYQTETLAPVSSFPHSEPSMVDLSGLVSPDEALQPTQNFHVPDLPQEDAVPQVNDDQDLEMDLDLELEREFAQLINDEPEPQSVDSVSDGNLADYIDNAFAAKNPALSEAIDANTANEDQFQMSDLNYVFAADRLSNNNAAAAKPAPQPSVMDNTMPVDKQVADHNTSDIEPALHASANLAQNTPPGRSFSPILGAAGFLALLLVAGGAYLIFGGESTTQTASGEPPIINASNEPIKERPENPGGQTVLNQDQAVYEQVEGRNVSSTNQPSLVEGAEEPVDIVQRTLNPDVLPSGINETVKSDERLVADGTEVALTTQNNENILVAPRKVRTIVVRPDGSIVQSDIEAAAAQSANQLATQNDAQNIASAPTSQNADQLIGSGNNATDIAGGDAPSANPVVDQFGQTLAAAVDTAVAATSTETTNVVALNRTSSRIPVPVQRPSDLNVVQQQAAPLNVASNNTVASAPVTQQSASQPVQQAASNFDGYYIQIASQPSLDAAQRTYATLSNRFGSVIGGLGVDYQRAEIAGKGIFHRVRIPVGTRSEANALCNRYKSAGGSCYPVK